MKKKKYKVICPDCDKEIIGFSEHHAQENLKIHRETSKQCKDIKRILKKKLKK